jgi:hypothetical protein
MKFKILSPMIRPDGAHLEGGQEVGICKVFRLVDALYHCKSGSAEPMDAEAKKEFEKYLKPVVEPVAKVEDILS